MIKFLTIAVLVLALVIGATLVIERCSKLTLTINTESSHESH